MTDQRSVFPAANATEEERLYFDVVDRAFETNQVKPISNGQPSHAVYLLYRLLTGAEHRVVIYTGHLRRTLGDVLAYGEPVLAEAAVRFLKRPETELLLAVAEDLDVDGGMENVSDHPFIRAILKAGDAIKGKLRLYDVKDATLFPYHFIVMDERAFRVEVDTEKAQAYASFGDTEFAQVLATLFDHFAETSREVELPVAA